ncbi:MAG: hypothetical protein ABIR96_05870 [Bdellovibrionota bacterium]
MEALKIWAVFFFFVLLGQLRVSQGTLEQRFHSYINQSAQQKFFVTLLHPVHSLFIWAGFDIDEKSIQMVRDAKVLAPDPVVTPFMSPQQIQNAKRSIKERKRVLKEVEETP